MVLVLICGKLQEAWVSDSLYGIAIIVINDGVLNCMAILFFSWIQKIAIFILVLDQLFFFCTLGWHNYGAVVGSLTFFV